MLENKKVVRSSTTGARRTTLPLGRPPRCRHHTAGAIAVASATIPNWGGRDGDRFGFRTRGPQVRRPQGVWQTIRPVSRAVALNIGNLR